MGHQTRLPISFGGISLLSMEDCAPIYFFKGIGLSWFRICASFAFSIDPLWRNMFIKLRGAPHLLQLCFCATQSNLPPTTRKMHPSFESLVITGTWGLHASLMDIHHDASFRFILEDDSISLASKTCIRSCSNKGIGLWLIIKSSISSFHIAHYIFTLMLYFHLSLI